MKRYIKGLLGALPVALALVTACGSGEIESDEPVWTLDERGESLTKCQDASGNGYIDFCADLSCLCASGEGDCDADYECQSGLVCGYDNGPNFGMQVGVDVCVPPHCRNGVQDSGSGETGVDCGGACGACPTCPLEPNGGNAHCSTICPCTTPKDGDCDSNAECGAGLVCVPSVGYNCGYSWNLDACLATHCGNGTQDGDETGVDCGGSDCCACSTCPPNGQANTCSPTCKCDPGWGDCDGDAECKTGLVCGFGKGAQFGLKGLDVCVPPHCTNGSQDADEQGVDCGGADCGTCIGGTGGQSCAGGLNICGPGSSENCCAVTSMPLIRYFRNYDGVLFTDASNRQATVSAYKLDKFEVTVGRFRKFVADFDNWRAGGNPADGAGAHPLIASSGWNAGFNLTADAATMTAGLACDPTYATWSAAVGSNAAEARPINCVTWAEAFAFCNWDGGRLPTEAEWNAVASHAQLQRVYPWSSPSNSTLINTGFASYACGGDGNPNTCAATDLLPVGSLPNGNALLGNADMAGNVWEWVLDYYQPSVPYPCFDCANVTNASQWRVIKGGSFLTFNTTHLAASMRSNGSVVNNYRAASLGFRCARD